MRQKIISKRIMGGGVCLLLMSINIQASDISQDFFIAHTQQNRPVDALAQSTYYGILLTSFKDGWCAQNYVPHRNEPITLSDRFIVTGQVMLSLLPALGLTYAIDQYHTIVTTSTEERIGFLLPTVSFVAGFTSHKLWQCCYMMIRVPAVYDENEDDLMPIHEEMG